MASREGFDLFTKWGRQHLLRRIRSRDFSYINRYVWRDTFGRLGCMVRGHKLSTGRTYDDGTGSWPCFRCNKFVRAATETEGGSDGY